MPTLPTLVHGVDISTLEGWMVKINSNPSMFGKAISRRWFCVSFVPAGSEQKLIISYSTNKSSKEPRGWLYIEDISGVYCRRDMIEVVSPARTLRFKGETTVEHRLWSDSLHKLCNPPKSEAPSISADEEKRLAVESATLRERQRAQDRGRDRIADPKKTREFVDSGTRERVSAHAADEAKASARNSGAEAGSSRAEPLRRRDSPPEQRAPQRKHESPSPRSRDRRNNGSDENDEHSECASASGEEEDEAPPLRRHHTRTSPQENARSDSRGKSPTNRAAIARDHPHLRSSPREPAASSAARSDHECGRLSPREQEDERRSQRSRRQDSDASDDDDDDEGKDEAPRQAKATLERRPSLLVASIKSMSPIISSPAESKSKTPSTKEAKAGQTHYQASPSKQDARVDEEKEEQDGGDSVYDDEDPHEESPRDRVTEAAPTTSKPAARSTEYFDEDNHEEQEGEEEEEETNNKRRPSVPSAPTPKAAAPVGEIRADNNFADDDWDAEESTLAPSSKHHASPEKRTSVGLGGVAADSNFATEDWD